MARKPRYYLPDVPCHVIQRGHNREPCFYAPEDFRYYLQCLREACLQHHAAVHAYVLLIMSTSQPGFVTFLPDKDLCL